MKNMVEWVILCKEMWKMWGKCGKMWENVGKTLGKYWENIGKKLGKCEYV